MRFRPSLLLALFVAAAALYAAPLHAQSSSPGPFFDDETFLGFDENGSEAYYLSYFKEYTYATGNATYVYKYDFGWLCYLGGTSPTSRDAYFYDCTSGDYFWLDSSSYPYFYSFNMNTFLYYYENSSPRVFYDFALKKIIVY